MVHDEIFRAHTLDAARARASARGLRGAMYPWEADPENGSEQTPHFAWILGEREIHVNADVAIAQYQYWQATRDRDWLRQRGWLIPAYSFPENRQDLDVLRIVVRAGMTMEMAELLLDHFQEQTDFLESLDAPLPGPKPEVRKAFAH